MWESEYCYILHIGKMFESEKRKNCVCKNNAIMPLAPQHNNCIYTMFIDNQLMQIHIMTTTDLILVYMKN